MKSCQRTDKTRLRKGAWSREEDQKLIAYINRYGIWNWTEMPKAAGLLRGGKSCRLRWMNYLRPGIKHGEFSQEEDETIIKLHQLLGNRWSAIASRLPGRTDNEIKNHWHTSLKKCLKNNPQVPTTNLQGIQEDIDVKQKSSYEDDDTSFFNRPKASNCNDTIPLMPLHPFDNIPLPTVDRSGEIYNNQNICEENNSSSGSTYQELQSSWYQTPPYPMEGFYMVEDYGVTNTNPEFLVSTPQFRGFQENSRTFASYDDDSDDLFTYLLMEANEESLVNSFFY